MSMIGSLGRCKGPVSRPSTSGIAAHKISRLIREGGRGRQCEAGPVAQAREGASQDGETALLPAMARYDHPVPATGICSGCYRTWTSPDYAVKSAMTAPNGPPSPAAGAAYPRLSLRRLAPLVVVVVGRVRGVAFGWHRQLSFEQVARHHEALGAFIAMHELQA